MKKILSLRSLLAVLFVIAGTVASSAASYTTKNGVRYRYNTAKTEVYVTVLSDNKVYVGDVVIPATIQNSSGQTIPVVGVYASAFSDCTNLTSVTLAESVTAIGDYAFDGCEGLTHISMPGVKTIGHWSFRNCESLTDLTFGDKLQSIGNYCFDKNLKLEVVDLPASVTNIGGYAFEGNPQITTVISRATTPPAIKKGYLDGEEIYTLFEDNDYGNIKLYVPEASIMDYKQTLGWLQFGNNIYALETLGVDNVGEDNSSLSVTAVGNGCIEINAAAPVNINIVNLNGQLVKFESVNAGKTVIKNLPSGLVIVNGNKVLVR